MNQKSLGRIIAYIVVPIVACIILFILEQILTVDYYTKTIAKIILFISIPIFVNKLMKSSNKHIRTSNNSVRDFKIGVCIGLGIIIVILLAYVVFKKHIDSTAILRELSNKSNITKQNYPFIGLYIIFGNSFLEEYFFRNFMFINFYRAGWKNVAYASSSLLFSIYHVSIFKTWFPSGIILLSLLGLLIAGLFLDYVNTKSNSIFNSWIIHICADIAVIGIGYMWLLG